MARSHKKGDMGCPAASKYLFAKPGTFFFSMEVSLFGRVKKNGSDEGF